MKLATASAVPVAKRSERQAEVPGTGRCCFRRSTGYRGASFTAGYGAPGGAIGGLDPQVPNLYGRPAGSGHWNVRGRGSLRPGGGCKFRQVRWDTGNYIFVLGGEVSVDADHDSRSERHRRECSEEIVHVFDRFPVKRFDDVACRSSRQLSWPAQENVVNEDSARLGVEEVST